MNPESLRVATRDGALELRSLGDPPASELVLVQGAREYGLNLEEARRIVEAMLSLFEGRTRGIPALHPDGHRWHWLFTSLRPHALFYGRRVDAGMVIKIVGDGQRVEIAIGSDEAARWSAAVRLLGPNFADRQSTPG